MPLAFKFSTLQVYQNISELCMGCQWIFKYFLQMLINNFTFVSIQIINLQEVINKLQKTVKDLQDSSTSHTEDNSKIGEVWYFLQV